jgi:acetyltransferase-like isoleucine patch superfamily enzyme
MQREPIALVGWEDGAAGQVDSWIAECGYEVVCFVHPDDEPPTVDAVAARNRPAKRFDFPANGAFKGRPLLSARDWPSVLAQRGIRCALVTLADKQQRVAEIRRAQAAGIELPAIMHSSVLVLADAVVGRNVIAHARAIVGYRSEIGDGVILGIGVQLDHHNVVREGVTLDPAAVTAGNVLVERYAHVHAGAAIINRITIGEASVVAAGAVVTSDVAPHTMVAGVPAREKKKL